MLIHTYERIYYHRSVYARILSVIHGRRKIFPFRESLYIKLVNIQGLNT